MLNVLTMAAALTAAQDAPPPPPPPPAKKAEDADARRELERAEEELAKEQRKLNELQRAMAAKTAELARKRAELARKRTLATAKKWRLELRGKPGQFGMTGPFSWNVGGKKYIIGVMTEAPSDGKGVVVREVTVGKPAAEAGVKPGDRIITVNGIAIKMPDALSKIIQAAGDQKLILGIARGGEKGKVEIKLVPARDGGVRTYTFPSPARVAQPPRVTVREPAFVPRQRLRSDDSRMKQLEKRLAAIEEMLKKLAEDRDD